MKLNYHKNFRQFFLWGGGGEGNKCNWIWERGGKDTGTLLQYTPDVTWTEKVGSLRRGNVHIMQELSFLKFLIISQGMKVILKNRLPC
jgi:hypothetical protein